MCPRRAISNLGKMIKPFRDRSIFERGAAMARRIPCLLVPVPTKSSGMIGRLSGVTLLGMERHAAKLQSRCLSAHEEEEGGRRELAVL
jgi:hypothetical protein